MDYLTFTWSFLLALSAVCAWLAAGSSGRDAWRSLCGFLIATSGLLAAKLSLAEGELLDGFLRTLAGLAVFFSIRGVRDFLFPPRGAVAANIGAALAGLLAGLSSPGIQVWTWTGAIGLLVTGLFFSKPDRSRDPLHFVVGTGVALLLFTQPFRALPTPGPLGASDTVPVLLASLGCALCLVGTWLSARRGSPNAPRTVHWPAAVFAGVLIVLLAGGHALTQESTRSADETLRAQLKQEASVAASTIPTALIEHLHGLAGDEALPAYKSLKSALAAVTNAGAGYPFSYLMIKKDGRIVFLADSEPAGSPDESLPGDVFHDAPTELASRFRSTETFVAGPYRDEWGFWVSGFVPVKDAAVDGSPVRFGLDREASAWVAGLAELRKQSMLLTLLLCLIATGAFAVSQLALDARSAQAASEESLQLALMGAGLAAWELDPATRTVRLGGSWEPLIGRTPPRAPVPYAEFLEMVATEDRESVRSAFDGILENTADRLECEMRLVREDGSAVWVFNRGRVIRQSPSGEALRAAGSLLDISDRKAAEGRLEVQRRELELMALVAAKTTNAVIITNARGEIEWANEGFTRITGYLLSEARGKRPGSLLQGPDTDATVVARMRSAIREGRAFSETVRNYSREGSSYWVSIECQPLREADGTLHGFMAIEQDITRRVEAEEALEIQRQRVQRINSSLLRLSDCYEENLRSLTELAGEIFEADCALYNRLEGEMLFTQGRYKAPPDLPDSDRAEGHLCFDVIRNGSQFLFVENLFQTSYAETDPNVRAYNLESYVGHGVSVDGETMGSLCVVFTRPFELTDDLRDCLSIIAQAIGREELLHQNRQRLQVLTAEEATQRSRLLTLLKSLDDAVLVEDASRAVTFANPAFERMFGIPLSRIEGANCGELADSAAGMFDHPASFLDSIDAVLRTGVPSLAREFRMRDGRHLARDFVPIAGESTGSGYLWRYRDVTRERRNQNILRAVADVGEFILRTPLASPAAWNDLAGLLGTRLGVEGIGVFKYYRDSGDLPVPYLAEICRWSREAIASAGPHIPLETEPDWLARVLEGETLIARRDSATARTLCLVERGHLLVIGLSGGEGFRGFLAIQDAAECSVAWTREEIALLESAATLIGSRLDLQRSERALVLARDAADAANRAKSAFLATMSHEIRTPLNAVIGMSSLLLETELNPAQRDYARTVASSGETLLELIDDVLDYSKIEAGRIEIESVIFDLPKLLQETAGLFTQSLAEKGVQFAKEISPQLPTTVSGDRTRLKQVLINLLSNASKFTAAGCITLGAAPRSGQDVVFRVSDTGIGMAPDVIEKLFQPFTQADSSVTRRFGGTGLGLAISKRLVELMGGRIEVFSEAGQGTTFTVTLPLAPSKGGIPDAAQAPHPRVGNTAAPLRVLVAEDNPTNQKVIRLMLQRLGADTSIVSNGAEAVAEARREPFDLILLDVQMAVMDGLSAAGELRTHFSDKAQRPRIVALTANAFREDRDACLAAGMDDYLAKPLSFERLRALLAETERISPS